MKYHLKIMLLALVPFCAPGMHGQGPSNITVFYEDGFPSADAPVPDREILRKSFDRATFATTEQLEKALISPKGHLLVLPFGSAFPESRWRSILNFLDDGGSLLVVGGQPFTRPAYKDQSGWHLRTHTTGFSLELFIDDYQETPGSDRLRFLPNADFGRPVAPFAWQRGFSPVLRLSVTQKYLRDGATGDLDARLTPLAWGVRDGHKLSAPAIVIDHDRQRFVGSRWVLLNCELPADFYRSGSNALLEHLGAIALRRSDRFELRPAHPLFVAGEPLTAHFSLLNGTIPTALATQKPDDQLKLHIAAEQGGTSVDLTVPSASDILLPAEAASGKGFHTIEATLLRGGEAVGIYRSGFWMRDREYLASGEKLTVGSDYFLLNGKPLPVVGTTYMSSDVQRLFLMRPNVYVWERDMQDMRSSGMNMLRTGIWSGWEDMVDANGRMTDDTLRSIEAFLMSARHYRLPVQFNLFAFLPEIFGGINPYLDPAAIVKQNAYVQSAVKPFSEVPFLSWDLINEPSINRNLWRTVPAGDRLEAESWKAWLKSRYATDEDLAHAWAIAPYGTGRLAMPQQANFTPRHDPVDLYRLPSEQDFGEDKVRGGYNPLRAHDYFLFSQAVFTRWTQGLYDLIRSQGSRQLITVGQEEKGVASRISPVFFGDAVDFTCDHTWWDFDGSLWASLSAKLPNKPMLVQETGEQRRVTEDNHLRFSPEVEALQMERKLAFSFATGAGAIQWLWNVNSYMGKDDEVTIGTVRPDATEMPIAEALRGFARVAEVGAPYFKEVRAPEIAIVAGQSLQFSQLNDAAVAVQKHAVRALAYHLHMPARIVSENRLKTDLGGVKLAILPSVQALSDSAWETLLAFAKQGGTLLITGPADRDEHWAPTDRMQMLGIRADEEPVSVREATITIGDSTYTISYSNSVQELQTQRLHLPSNKSFVEVEQGKGRILWFADPVEFGEGYEANAAVYRVAVARARIDSPMKMHKPLSSAVLAFPTVLPEAILYAFSNESFSAQPIDFEDVTTHVRVNFQLKAQGGGLLLLRKSDGAIVSSYGLDSPALSGEGAR